MPEMRQIACPSCESANLPLSVVDGIEEYRCRKCGLVYYGPCGCDIVHEVAITAPAVEKKGLEGDWQTSRVPVSVEGASGVRKYPGCS